MQRGHCQTFAGANHNLLLNRLLSCLIFSPLVQKFFDSFSCFLILEFVWQVRPALPALERLVHSNDEEVLTDACWALSYLSDGTNDKIQAVIEAGVCTRLVQLLLWVLPSVDVFLLLLQLFYRYVFDGSNNACFASDILPLQCLFLPFVQLEILWLVMIFRLRYQLFKLLIFKILLFVTDFRNWSVLIDCVGKGSPVSLGMSIVY